MAERPTEIPRGTRAPGYARAPAHRVALVPRHRRVVIATGDRPLADTADVVDVEESGYPPRHYLAREGVDMSRLEKADKVTYCPFKGLATYYVIRDRDGDITNAVWSYEEPYLEAELLRDRLAFDAAQVHETVADTE